MTIASPSISIRSYHLQDEISVKEITYKTGFKGEDLTGRSYCDDPRLWFLIFIAYYAYYENQHFFVAVDSTIDQVIGFICGTPDTLTQEKIFRQYMIPRIALRLFFYTSWRYPRSFKKILSLAHRFSSTANELENDSLIHHFPAHMHINLLPGYQGLGIGTQLFSRFEQHISSLGVIGLHLRTTNKNSKAVPFYQKIGFTIYHESEVIPHQDFDDLRELIFVKTIKD